MKLILESAKVINKCANKLKVFGEATVTSMGRALEGIVEATILIDIEEAKLHHDQAN